MKIQSRSKREFWLCGFLMTAGLLLYHSLYVQNIYPFTEGWGIYYVELLNRGQIPYRDFFYYLPPLNLVVDWLFWTLSFGNLLAFRMWYIVQRLVIVWLLYNLLTKWFKPRYAWIGCLVGMIMRSAVVWDLGGDYNQTQTLLALFLMYAVVWFLEKDANSELPGLSRYKYIALAGAIIAMMVLLKQSAGLSALLVCFAFLVMYCIAFQDKRFLQYCAATAAGAVIPFAACGLYLTVNGALFPFIEQFFGVAAAKGGVGTILFACWRVVLTNWEMMLLFAAAGFVVYSAYCAANEEAHPAVLFGSLLLLALTATVSCVELLTSLNVFLDNSNTLYVGLIALVLMVCLFAVYEPKRSGARLKNKDRNIHSWFMVALFVVVFLVIRLDVKGISVALYNTTTVFRDIPAVITYFSLFTSIICLLAQAVHYMRHGQLLYSKAMMFLFAGGLADAYANMMNSSSDVYPIAAFINAAALVCLLFSLNMRKWNRVKNLVICAICVVICASAMVQKYTTAYSWWGSEVTYSLDQRTEEVDLDAMAGLRLAPQRKLEFEQVTKLIEENDDEDSTVWGFPHVKIFNILTDHYNTEDPVPVLFYDVCSDNAALQELEWLKENNPDFVVWCDMPWCLEVHEDVFRNGASLGQREIVNWFSSVRMERYICIGQVGNLFVYKLNDGSPINYTYFQDPNALNTTAGEFFK